MASAAAIAGSWVATVVLKRGTMRAAARFVVPAIIENELFSLDCLCWLSHAEVLLKQFFAYSLKEMGNIFGASVGTDSSREYSFQNRHASLYLTCITPCEAQKQRGLLLVFADK